MSPKLDPFDILEQRHKTDWLSLIFSRHDHYSFVCGLWVKSLIQVKNHLHRFHGNSNTTADHAPAECAVSKWNSYVRKQLAVFHGN